MAEYFEECKYTAGRYEEKHQRQTYRLMRDVLKKNVDKPRPINTKENRRYYRYICDPKRYNARMQIFPQLIAGGAALAGVVAGYKYEKEVKPVLAAVEHAAGDLSEAATGFSAMITQIQNLITSTLKDTAVKMYKNYSFTELVFDVLVAILNVYFARDDKKVESFILNILRAFVHFGIREIGLLLIRKVKDLLMPRAEMQGIDVLPNWVKTLGMVILTLLGVATGKASYVISRFGMFMKFMATMNLTIKNIKDFKTNFPEYFDQIIRFFKLDILGFTSPDETDKYIVGYRDWADEVVQLLNRDHFTDESSTDKLAYDQEAVRELESLYRRGLEHAAEISLKKLPRDLQLHHHQLMRLVTEKYKQVDMSGAFGEKPRPQPLVIWLCGESGVGKSGMSWPLSLDLNANFVRSANEARNFAGSVYFRNVEQDFWDGYHGQNVLVYDDFAQTKDTVQKPNPEIMEIIRSANIAPHNLHMAQLEEKKKTRMTSKVIIMTSNVRNQALNSITHPQAFYRRVNICAEVTVKPEFAYEVKTDNGTVQRLDYRKLGAGIRTDVYLIQRMDAETGKYEGKPMEYEEFVAFCQSELELETLRCHNMIKGLETYAHERYSKMVNFGKGPDKEVEAQLKYLETHDIQSLAWDDELSITSFADMQIGANCVHAFEDYYYGEYEKFRIFDGLTIKERVLKYLPQFEHELITAEDAVYNFEIDARRYVQEAEDESQPCIYYPLKQLKRRLKITPLNMAIARKERENAVQEGAKVLSAIAHQIEDNKTKFDWNDTQDEYDMDQEQMHREFHAFPTMPLEFKVACKLDELKHVADLRERTKTELFTHYLKGSIPLARMALHHICWIKPGFGQILVPITEELAQEWFDRAFDDKPVPELYWAKDGTRATKNQISKIFLDCDYVSADINKFFAENFMIYTRPIVGVVRQIARDLVAKLKSYADKVREIWDSIPILGQIAIPITTAIVMAASMGYLNFFFQKSIQVVEQFRDGWRILVTPKTPKFNQLAKQLTAIPEGDPIGIEVTPSYFNKHQDKLAKLDLSSELKVKLVEIQQSGDAVTKAAKKAVVEIHQSGDQVTKAAKKAVVEIHQSGDQLTKASKKVVVEALCNAEVLKNTARTYNGDMQVWKDTTAQLLITNRILGNQYRIFRHVENGLVPLLNILFVRGSHAIAPGHLQDFLRPDDTITILNASGVRYTMPWAAVQKRRIYDAEGQTKEAIMLSFPKTVATHADLVKHFSDSDSMSLYSRADVCLPLLRNLGKDDSLTVMLLGNFSAEFGDSVPLVTPQGEYMVRRSIYYMANTIAGDCGAPVIVNETKVLRKITGIHVAAMRTGRAIGENITQKDLERTFNNMDMASTIIFDPDDIPNYIPMDANMQVNTSYEANEVKELLQLPGTNFNHIGQVTVRPYSTNKTTLRPSMIHGEVTEPTTMPSALHSKECNIYHKNIEKFSNVTPFIESPELDLCCKAVQTKLLNNIRKELQRVLTIQEAVQGSDISEYIGPIDRSTSAGYPWILKREGGAQGKRTWLGKDDYKITDEVHEAVCARIMRARQGIRTPVVWTDTLKDERRPIAKVKAFKTRIFAHGPLDFTIAFRMYFLGFIAHIMENNIRNEQGLGTNVYSYDWERLVKHLGEVGDNVVAGDFQCFDGTLNAAILKEFVRAANEFYDDGEDNALVRLTLFQEVVNSVHMMEGILYNMNHSQPSGNPSTTALNSFYNSVIVRRCFLECAVCAGKKATMDDFEKFVRMESYGDDNLISIHSSILEWFNQHTITTAMAKFGMTYTDEAKTGEYVPPSRSIREVAFLKRGFVQRGKTWIAPLDINTCLEMVNWCRDSVDPVEATRVNCETAIKELGFHDREVFEKYATSIERAFRRKTGYSLKPLTYDMLKREHLEEYNA